MNVSVYKTYVEEIDKRGKSQSGLDVYRKLCDIFIQDCVIGHEDIHYGNLTKEKARLLFSVQKYFV